MDMDNTLKNIAKKLANKAHMPYAWEDFYNRLYTGSPLPVKFKDYITEEKQPPRIAYIIGGGMHLPLNVSNTIFSGVYVPSDDQRIKPFDTVFSPKENTIRYATEKDISTKEGIYTTRDFLKIEKIKVYDTKEGYTAIGLLYKLANFNEYSITCTKTIKKFTPDKHILWETSCPKIIATSDPNINLPWDKTHMKIVEFSKDIATVE